MSHTSDQKRFTISEVTADWHELWYRSAICDHPSSAPANSRPIYLALSTNPVSDRQSVQWQFWSEHLIRISFRVSAAKWYIERIKWNLHFAHAHFNYQNGLSAHAYGGPLLLLRGRIRRCCSQASTRCEFDRLCFAKWKLLIGKINNRFNLQVCRCCLLVELAVVCYAHVLLIGCSHDPANVQH